MTEIGGSGRPRPRWWRFRLWLSAKIDPRLPANAVHSTMMGWALYSDAEGGEPIASGGDLTGWNGTIKFHPEVDQDEPDITWGVNDDR